MEPTMKYGDLQAISKIDLASRIAVFEREVDRWTKADRITAAGLSPSQRVALIAMITGLKERQRTVLEKLQTATEEALFGDAIADFIMETTGANELWRLFHFILEQSEDSGLQGPVKAAVRIAGDCYAHCIRKARLWQAIEPNRLREQPLVYLDAVDSPATASRGTKVQLLSLAVRQWRNLTLPLPFVLLPLNFAQSIWTFCALHHETGHNLDQDLHILQGLRGKLPETVPLDQEPAWRRWSGEILADALGIVLGGAGFAVYLSTEALLLGPAHRFRDLDPDAVHPPFLVRIPILTAMLRQTEVAALIEWADELDDAWRDVTKPQWMQPFIDAAPLIAKLFLTGKLDALKGRTVLDFNPQLAADHQRASELSKWFCNCGARPDPNGAEMYPRLVPAAAQLALRAKAQPTSETLAALHARAIQYLELIPPGPVLAGGAERRQYLTDLMRTQSFPTNREGA
jgi:hypothetical protein